MADLTITAASVVPDDGFSYVDGVFGETVTAGQPVYKKASDGLYYKADANGAGTEIWVVAGIALNGGAVNQPGRIMTGGTLTIGATVAIGTIYVLSATAGGIAPSTDLASGWKTSILGVASTVAKLAVKIINSGSAVP